MISSVVFFNILWVRVVLYVQFEYFNNFFYACLTLGLFSRGCSMELYAYVGLLSCLMMDMSRKLSSVPRVNVGGVA